MDTMPDFIKSMEIWITIWPKDSPNPIRLSFLRFIYKWCLRSDSIGKTNGGAPYLADGSVRMGAAFGAAVRSYNERTHSSKPRADIPVDAGEKLEDWWRQRKLDWMMREKRKNRIMCRIKVAERVKWLYADTFIAVLAMALGFDAVRVGTMPNRDPIGVSLEESATTRRV